MSRPDRRLLIADAALALAAEGGNRAVSHGAVDGRLGLPKGSTSYYFRTREALVAAMAARLIGRSREAFKGWSAGADEPEPVIVGYLAELVTARRGDVLARFALLAESGQPKGTREDLANCLFSGDGARALAASVGAEDPVSAAELLIAALEGLVFTYTLGRCAPARETADLETELRPQVAALLANMRAR